MIYIASDHGGLELKKEIILFLQQTHSLVRDMGPTALSKEDDYPDYAKPLCERVQQEMDARGILICRNGVGMEILANKFKGIRATVSWSPDHAKSSRNDDDTNVLAIPADYVSRQLAFDIVKTWLSTPFSKEDRFVRRLTKVSEVEK
jgi:ribose 5-phosphate isomerase B